MPEKVKKKIGIITKKSGKNITEKIERGITLIKGVNRQVVELNGAESEYFERILFFVKPECSSVSEGKLRERANLIVSQTGAPPTSRVTRSKLKKAASLILAAAAGAAASGLISLAVK